MDAFLAGVSHDIDATWPGGQIGPGPMPVQVYGNLWKLSSSQNLQALPQVSAIGIGHAWHISRILMVGISTLGSTRVVATVLR